MKVTVIVKKFFGEISTSTKPFQMVSIFKDQIILCTPSFPLFMWISAVAEEEELGGSTVGYTRRRRRISTQAGGFNASVITSKQLHLSDIGQGWPGQGVIWNRIE